METWHRKAQADHPAERNKCRHAGTQGQAAVIFQTHIHVHKCSIPDKDLVFKRGGGRIRGYSEGVGAAQQEVGRVVLD